MTRVLKRLDGTILDKATVATFINAFGSQALLPGNAGYDSARRLWNASIDKYPGLIVRCLSAADVVRAVKFARANNLLVAIKSGGDKFAGRGWCDDGIGIDLPPM